MTYSTIDVPVAGGTLRVGRWSPDAAETSSAAASTEHAASAPAPVVAIHGITAHHMSWPHVVDELADTEILAPDLRGRGRSRDLPPDVGLAAHADDVAAVIREAARDRPVVVVGHSMGGFVALVFAHRHPELVAGLVLVDGGFPFAEAEKETTLAGLDLIRARLEARFASPEEYVELFRAHPAFANDWSDVAAGYARYDVTGTPPECHASAVVDAVVADQHDVMGSTEHAEALRALADGEIDVPVVFLRAPRGFVDDPPGLYAPETVEGLRARFPTVVFEDVEGVNHYTIVLGAAGAEAVARAVRAVQARAAS
ncbi:alpha/beta fold hydrolase [Mobilicoccus massiliensis]|uniref:alpha/beta fold hydrolase n=1 Tax=Mobilicoccus massiliensis TaxID=1522310 RepID=UPI00058C99E1|nr:alpha/beta hydrolase [Mobilicoccus massiliensis]